MVYKSFNGKVIVQLLLFFAASAGMTFAFLNQHWLLFIPLALLSVVLFFNLLYLLNSTNRKITYFFDSVINEDTSLHYPENVGPRSLNTLHNSLNRLNNHIAGIKIKNEHNEKFFLELLRTSATGLMAVNEKGYIEHINDAALEFLNLQQISHMDLLRQKNTDLYDRMEMLKPGQSQTIKVLQNNELRLFSLKTSMLSFGDEKYKLYSISDIKTELEENELDSWQKLIRVMTHEIMNSVAPITSLSNTLSRIFIRDNNPLPPEEVTRKHVDNIIDGLGVIENTGKGLMRFVEDYRQLTRVPEPRFQTIQILPWIMSLQLLMNEKLSTQNVLFEIINEGAPPELTGDEKLLNQVMINLLNNAIEALDNVQHKKIILGISGNNSGRLKLTISDNGRGIPPEETEKIFIPFYTTREEGSGIGLSICRKIMRLHKGSISVHSVPGIKTTFTLNF
ncbi:MAG TPA: ATP-binding protein [Bacteroidales bacterium]|nr:ATP-binding protein [Bacteroidales bacterium]